MIWLYILLGLLALISWLFTRKIKICLGYCQKPFLSVKLLFIEFNVLENGEKASKSSKKEAKNKQKEAKKSKKDEEKDKQISVSFYIKLFTNAIKEIVSKLKKYLFLEKYILKIDLATDDAAKTALLYPAVCTAAGSLWTVVDKVGRKSKNNNNFYTEIKPDFYCEKTDFYVDIMLSIRVWQALSLGFTLLNIFDKVKNPTDEVDKNE